MATITGLTAARMQEIIDKTVVDADVVGDNLILTLDDGSTIDAGNVRGAPGTDGADGSGVAKVTAFPGSPADGDLVVRTDLVGDPLYKRSDGVWELINSLSTMDLTAAIAALSPTSWWKMDEAGGALADSGSAGIAGTAVTFSSSKIAGPDENTKAFGTGAGQGAAVATFGNNYGFAARLPFTFLLFHRPDGNLLVKNAAYGANSRRIMMKNDTTAGPYMGLDTGGNFTAVRYGGGGPACSPGVPIRTGEWNMYLIKYDGNILTCRINSKKSSIADTGSMPSSSNSLRLNGEPANTSDWGAPGWYSNFAVWNRALTDAEGDAIYRAFRTYLP